jgi:hypothetical protein
MSRKFIFGGSFASAVPLLLDLYPATAAYSVRKLRTAYTGACMRVRRSSDNTEQDIGFSGNDLDTAALLSFVGSTNGFVTTWYDQQGSNNVVQTSSASQPRIVASGVVELENGKPSINWYGTSQFLNGGNILNIGLGNDMAAFLVARNAVTTNRSQLISKSVSTGVVNRYALATGGGLGTSCLVHTNAGFVADPSSSVAHANQRLFNFRYLRNLSVSAHVDNSLVANSSAPTGQVDVSTYRFLVGATNNSTNNGEIAYHRGTFQEIVIYQQSTTPLLSDVNTIINAYYGIY